MKFLVIDEANLDEMEKMLKNREVHAEARKNVSFPRYSCLIMPYMEIFLNSHRICEQLKSTKPMIHNKSPMFQHCMQQLV